MKLELNDVVKAKRSINSGGDLLKTKLTVCDVAVGVLGVVVSVDPVLRIKWDNGYNVTTLLNDKSLIERIA